MLIVPMPPAKEQRAMQHNFLGIHTSVMDAVMWLVDSKIHNCAFHAFVGLGQQCDPTQHGHPWWTKTESLTTAHVLPCILPGTLLQARFRGTMWGLTCVPHIRDNLCYATV